MKEAVVVAYGRSPVGKAGKGSLAHTRPEDIAGQVIKGILDKTPQVKPEMIEDIISGCAMPEGEQGYDIARIIALKAGLPNSVPGQTINRFCSSGLQAVAAAANAIMAGQAECIIAGGVESMSLIPMGGYAVLPDPGLMEEQPGLYTAMGTTAENVAERYNVSREDMDVFAVESHRRAAEAIEAGKFDEEIIPIKAKKPGIDKNGNPIIEEFMFKMDESVRKGVTVEKMAKLKTVFKAGGSVTAGNSSQMNDAAAFLILMSKEKAEELGLKPIAIFKGFSVAGVDPEVMGIGPIAAVPKVLELTGLTLNEIDLIELNEAFASQSLAVIRELGLNKDIVNVNGGAIALGHPLGCTGAYLSIKLLQELKRRRAKYGLVTMCIGAGMGAAGIYEMVY